MNNGNENLSNEKQPSSAISASSARPTLKPEVACDSAHVTGKTRPDYPEMEGVEGVARISIDLNVSAAEIGGWEPNRIAAFFHGIVQAQRAASGLPYGSPMPVRLFCSCGGVVTEEEYQVHRQRGHDAGGLDLRQLTEPERETET